MSAFLALSFVSPQMSVLSPATAVSPSFLVDSASSVISVVTIDVGNICAVLHFSVVQFLETEGIAEGGFLLHHDLFSSVKPSVVHVIFVSKC